MVTNRKVYISIISINMLTEVPKLVSIIEKVTSKSECVEVCKKYSIVCIQQPIIIFSRVAEILYKKNEDANYAVCDSDARVELVRYENETELTNYCKKKKFDLIALVDKNGKGKIIPLEEMLEEEECLRNNPYNKEE